MDTSEEEIVQLFGDDDLNYLKNKNRGGSSNQKGNSYENYFTVYRLALICPEVIEKNWYVYFKSQVFAFIDDLIIHNVTNKSYLHFQLKNTYEISWGSGGKSISDDFKKQYTWNDSKSKKSQLHLVVSDSKLAVKLNNNVPKEIKDYTQVIHFPHESDIVRLIKQLPTFREALEYLSAFEKPDPDKIECVATVLLGAWVTSDKSSVSVMEVIEKAQKLSPSYIRCLSTTGQLDSEVENILNKIPNFSYNTKKGFLHWEHLNGLDSGTLPYSIESDNFTKFQNQIIKNNPTAFEDLESLLLGSYG